MIRHFCSRELQRLYEQGDESKIPPELVKKTKRIIDRLDVATQPSDMDLPGLRLHPLKGNLKGHWAVKVSGNWRITFRFESGHVREVNLIDYH